MNRLFGSLIVGLFAPASLLAGVVFEIETKDHDSSRVGTTEVQADGKNLKMDVRPGKQGGKGKMIFRGDRGNGGEVVVVDDDRQVYYVMDRDSVSGLAGQAAHALSEVDKALAQLSKEQREAIEKLRGQQGGVATGRSRGREKAEIRNTGERGDKNGYPCVKYEVIRGGTKVRELWVTDWSNVEGGDEAAGAFLEMAEFFEEMLDSMGDAFGGGAGEGLAGNPYPELNFDQGFPVVVRSFEGGQLENESVLRSSRRQTLDPDAFEPPAGYKRQQMFPGD